MVRILILIGFLALVGFAIYKIWEGRTFKTRRKPKNACPKCDGQGYWEGLRGKEKCDECNGTGQRLY